MGVKPVVRLDLVVPQADKAAVLGLWSQFVELVLRIVP
jgi:hypothetical protein